MAETKGHIGGRISFKKGKSLVDYMTFKEAQELLKKFWEDRGLTGTELDKKYDEKELKAAMESIMGWSVVHLIKEDRSISKTDLHTDMIVLIEALKELH
jgi:hypothetical protein